MNKEKNRAFAYQLKHKGIKYSFIIVENKHAMPVGIIAYKGAITPRPGFVYLEKELYYFMGLSEGARAKCLFGKMSSIEDALTRMTSLALARDTTPVDVIKVLAQNTGNVKDFSEILIKGIRKYYNDK